MDKDYYELWHMRFDDEDRDYDKFLGIYSTREKAEYGLALLRDKPGFCDHPGGFEINGSLPDELEISGSLMEKLHDRRLHHHRG